MKQPPQAVAVCIEQAARSIHFIDNLSLSFVEYRAALYINSSKGEAP
jgi:hypothetical protein